MDLTRIKSAVLTQLIDADGLYSLKLQNHIYGCFIVMEDIAQNSVDVSGTILLSPTFTFDFDTQFNDIGLHYGFAMESKLTFDAYNPEYKNAWLQYFNDIDLARDINDVDKIEDSLIEIIQTNIKSDDSFFLNALETGSLSPEWINKVFSYLNPDINPVAPPSSPNDSDDEVVKTALTKAISEKPICKNKQLAKTRRTHPKIITSTKKSLAKTRRHHLKI
jgi:hypothetical protein